MWQVSGSSRRPRSGLVAVALAGAILGTVGCASSPEPVAFQNRVFYQYDTLVSPKSAKTFEVHYPPLDKAQNAPLPEYIGVSVLGDAVHLSRPRDWVIRSASLQDEHRYIEYVSPNEYMVAVYELVESPLDPWLGVMGRYEDQAKKAGADLIGQRIPMATENTQGRGYLVRRAVPAAKGPMLNYANEYLLRGERRIVLLQIVHHDEKLTPMDAELRRVVETLEVN